MGLLDFLLEIFTGAGDGDARSDRRPGGRTRSAGDLDGDMLGEAADRRFPVSFDYEDRGGNTSRRSGVHITKTGGNYVRGYDTDAGGPRTFRTGKMKNVDRDD